MKQFTLTLALATGLSTPIAVFAQSGVAGDVLPFPAPPMGGKVGPTMQESVHKWREAPSYLPEDAPNILIVMLDDGGFGQASTFGDKIKVGTLPAGHVTIAYEMRTPMERSAPAELTFWINGKEATKGTVQRTVAGFTASETFDVGMDTASPVADDYFDRPPFKFEGTLKRLHFKYL